MSEITIEKKLELMRQIRARNEQNRFDMSRREQIIYGRTTTDVYVEPERSWDTGLSMDVQDEEVEFQTFPLRILLSLALFLVIIICDLSGKSFIGINASQCFNAIAIDYESSITAWVDAASENTSLP